MNGLPQDGRWGPRTAAVYKVETERGDIFDRKCKVCGEPMRERDEDMLCPFRGLQNHVSTIVKRPPQPVRPNPSRSTWYCVPFVVGVAGLGHQMFFATAQEPSLVMLFATLVGLPAYSQT